MRRENFILGEERAGRQDVGDPFRRVLEIALRAQSPSSRDSNSTITVIDRISLALTKALSLNSERLGWVDEEGITRVEGPAWTLDRLLREAVSPIRRAGQADHAVILRLAQSLSMLAALAPPPGIPSLLRELTLTWETAERHIAGTGDLEEIRSATVHTLARYRR